MRKKYAWLWIGLILWVAGAPAYADWFENALHPPEAPAVEEDGYNEGYLTSVGENSPFDTRSYRGGDTQPDSPRMEAAKAFLPEQSETVAPELRPNYNYFLGAEVRRRDSAINRNTFTGGSNESTQIDAYGGYLKNAFIGGGNQSNQFLTEAMNSTYASDGDVSEMEALAIQYWERKKSRAPRN